MNKSINKNKKGFGLVEIVVASAMIGVIAVSLFAVFSLSTKLARDSADKIRAIFLAEEGLEVARFLRDDSWEERLAPLAAGTNYYLSFDIPSSKWSVTTSDPGPIGIFSRRVTVEDVYRDGSDNIDLAGPTLDPDSKKFNVEVFWGDSSIVLSAYLSDLFND